MANYIIMNGWRCAVTLTVLFLWGCGKMDDSYKEYLVPGGLTYPAKASGVKVLSGRNRVQLQWEKGSDPNTVKARVFWNSGSDSLEVDLSTMGDSAACTIEGLQERIYTFTIRTYGTDGSVSVPVEVVGTAYGDKYEQTIQPQPVLSSEQHQDDTLRVSWAAADTANGAVGNEVAYVSTDGTTKHVRLPLDEELMKIADVKRGSSYQYRTIFIPEGSSIDTFYTGWLTERILRQLDRSQWTISADSYAETSQLPNGGPPDKAIDGDVNTFWHTDHTTTRPPYPHWLLVDLKDVYSVARVQLISRPGVTNSFKEFIIQGSIDGVNWTSYDTYPFAQLDAPEDFPVTGEPEMRYIRIWALVGSSYHASLAELSVYAY